MRYKFSQQNKQVHETYDYSIRLCLGNFMKKKMCMPFIPNGIFSWPIFVSLKPAGKAKVSLTAKENIINKYPVLSNGLFHFFLRLFH